MMRVLPLVVVFSIGLTAQSITTMSNDVRQYVSVPETSVALTNVRVHNTAVAALTVNGDAKAMASNSVFSGSTTGVDIQQAGTSAPVDGSTISGNTTGILTNNGAMLRLSNSNVSFNGTGVNGTVNSFSNNRFVENGGTGTIAAIGGPTNPTGQQ